MPFNSGVLQIGVEEEKKKKKKKKTQPPKKKKNHRCFELVGGIYT